MNTLVHAFICISVFLVGGESLVQLPPEGPIGPIEPGWPICPQIARPFCKFPSTLKCISRNGCVHSCHCTNPCPLVAQPLCKPPAKPKCIWKNGCLVSCTCTQPCAYLPCLQSAANKCPNGVRLDDNGCRTCTCRDPCCPDPNCEDKCMMGFTYTLNTRGCRSCICKD